MSLVADHGDDRPQKHKKSDTAQPNHPLEVLSFNIDNLEDLWSQAKDGDLNSYPFFLNDSKIIVGGSIRILEGQFTAEFGINDPFAKNFLLSTPEKRKASRSLASEDNSKVRINWKKREINHLGDETYVTGTSKWPGGMEEEANIFSFKSTLKCSSVDDLRKELQTCLTDLKFYIQRVVVSTNIDVPETEIKVPTLQEIAEDQGLESATISTTQEWTALIGESPVSYATPIFELENILGFPKAVRNLQLLADDMIKVYQADEDDGLIHIAKRNIVVLEGPEKECSEITDALAGTLDAVHVIVHKNATFSEWGFQSFFESAVDTLLNMDSSFFVIEIPEIRYTPEKGGPQPGLQYGTGINPDFLFKILDVRDAWSQIAIVFTVSDSEILHPDMKNYVSQSHSLIMDLDGFRELFIKQLHTIAEKKEGKLQFEIEDFGFLTEILWKNDCRTYADIILTIENAVKLKAKNSIEIPITVNRAFLSLAWDLIKTERNKVN